jgi:hypothetical protein
VIRLFTGWDAREALGWHAFTQKAIERATERLSIIPLSGEQRDGSNSFIYARFEVPALCGYAGWAIFADASDMVCRADIAELWALRDERYAVQVVKHDYRTKHHRKYVGTEMECDNRDYPRKNWSSLILWNCGHPQNRILTPENVREWSGQQLHGFGWLPDDLIGALPIEWNWLAQEHGTNAAAKIIHYTAGIPQIAAYTCGSHSSDWFEAATSVYRTPAPMKLHAAA